MQDTVLKNPILPNLYSKLYFKIGLIIDEGDLRQKLYYHIGKYHNSILSPFLSLFEIKILFQNALNQLVFFNPEFWRWNIKEDSPLGDPSTRLSINHLRGAHSLLIILDLANYSESVQAYVKSLLSDFRHILHNNGNISVFVVGCYNGIDEPNPELNSFTLLKTVIPRDMKIYYTKVNINEIIERNVFQMFESFLFTEIYKEIFFQVKSIENNPSSSPRLIWNTSISNQFNLQKDYIPNENIKIADENIRCIAHGGLISKSNEVLQCSICKGYYCRSCFDIYLVSDICFGSLLTYKHRVILEDNNG